MAGIKLKIYEFLHWFIQTFMPRFDKWFEPLGVIPIIFHREILEEYNLISPNFPPPRPGDTIPLKAPKGRTADGYGVDVYNPTAGSKGAPIGRNCPMIPKQQRNIQGHPDVQLVAQRLLARTGFTPAGDQLNVISACWIQAMVHDWIGHYDDEVNPPVTLDKGAASGCPMASFRFKKTLENPDDEYYASFRTNWWDTSFVYGNNESQLNDGRAFEGGKFNIDCVNPNTLVQKNGVNAMGDNKNSWLGVELLQEIFIKEHNAVAEAIEKAHPDYDDEQIFDAARLVVAAVVAKIHTVDWTVELLKSDTLKVGMYTNWFGVFYALNSLGGWFYGGILFFLKYFPGAPLSLVGKKKADNKGKPYCLTEEFAAVYRLHSLLPDGLILGKDHNEFVRFEDLVAKKGRDFLRSSLDKVEDCWNSAIYYPCGNLSAHNYPVSMRSVAPTTEAGDPLPDEDKIDMAALDLHRDRERGILKHNDFRRALHLKPFKTWYELTGETNFFGCALKETPNADALEAVYGPAPQGIENLDLLVGDMYEVKPFKFALSETSFIIFVLMASRRLDADPFLNEYMTPEYYTQTGLDWVQNTTGMKDVIERHYPEVAKRIPAGNSAFKPYGADVKKQIDPWAVAIKNGVIPEDIVQDWEKVKADNDAFVKKSLSNKSGEAAPLLKDSSTKYS